VAVVTEKTFVIAEPGDPAFNQIPSTNTGNGSSSGVGATFVTTMVEEGRPMVMYQVAENEFLLVYHIGACFVTKCKCSGMLRTERTSR
jgi:hypothetical protein